MVKNRIAKRIAKRQNLAPLLPATLISSILAVILIINGCDSFMGDLVGDIDKNQLPIVEFTNVPSPGDTFSYAPVICWKGRDSDGFVELYAYADITDSAALMDPVYYIDFIPEEAWVETEATSDTVYLLTETGEITEHVFYLKCFDDQNVESKIIYRTFYRTNKPPNVPLIKWYTSPDTCYRYDRILSDTLYCLENITDTWPGLGFSWKSSDPDDRALYTIPLQFRYYLEKVPHDTIWKWVADDWTNKQELMFSDLETGHYIFSVWVRDDGLEISERSATIRFNVYKPTFEKPLLLLDITGLEARSRPGRGDVIPETLVGELYQQLFSPVTDFDYLHLTSDGIEVPCKSLLGTYKLVVLFSENPSSPDVITAIVDSLIFNYVLIGGRLWVAGYYLRSNDIISGRVYDPSDTTRIRRLFFTLDLADSKFANPIATYPPSRPDFIGATSGVIELPDLEVDTAKITEIYSEFIPRTMEYPFLPGIDIFTTGDDAETIYYFRSYTDTLTGDVIADTCLNSRGEPDGVKAFAESIFYPPTPFDCLVKMPKNRITEISRIENVTRGIEGEVLSWTNDISFSDGNHALARVSYPYGEPWSVNDIIVVDYCYQPTSETHLKPCAVRYEKLSDPREGQGLELRYRIAVFTFPLYFLDNSEGKVDIMIANMLTWFNQPQAH